MTMKTGDWHTIEPPFTSEQRATAVMLLGEPLVRAMEDDYEAHKNDPPSKYTQTFSITPDT